MGETDPSYTLAWAAKYRMGYFAQLKSGYFVFQLVMENSFDWVLTEVNWYGKLPMIGLPAPLRYVFSSFRSVPIQKWIASMIQGETVSYITVNLDQSELVLRVKEPTSSC